jgi:putative sterol carrier protein
MNPIEREKRELVKRIFERMVDLIDKEINLDEFKNTYFPHEDRTLEMNITGLEDVATGFVFEGGKVRTIKKLEDRATVVFAMDEDTFIRIATKRETFSEAFFYGELDIQGENYMRDFHIFKRMFDKYGYVLDKIGGR